MVLEALSGEKPTGQIAKEYGIHPNSVALWKKQFLEKGPELFSQDSTVQEYEGRIRASSSLSMIIRLCSASTLIGGEP